jgi:hypothetical protein
MSQRSQTNSKPQFSPSLNKDTSGLLQRKCSCGNSAGLIGKCSECQEKSLTLQRTEHTQNSRPDRPSIVHEVSQLPISKIQPKLKISQPNDKYEQEADRIADQVIRMPDPGVQRQVETEGAEEILQTKPIAHQITPIVQGQMKEEELQINELYRPSSSANPQTTPHLENEINAWGSGKPLPESVRAFYEPRFGADLSAVRIYTDSRAAQAAHNLQAQAFTNGWNIAFANGEYAPDTFGGRKLLAHELAHTLQQNSTQQNPISSSLIEPGSPLTSPAGSHVANTHVIQRRGPNKPSSKAKKSNASDKPDVTKVRDRVDRVIVSCDEMAVGFETSGAVYLYRLTECNEQVPPGIYQSKVTIDEEKQNVHFEPIVKPFTQAGQEEAPEADENREDTITLADEAIEEDLASNSVPKDFRFEWEIKPGQINPIVLLKDQDEVPVEYHGRIPAVTAERQECLLTKPPITVIPKQPTIEEDLSDALPVKDIEVDLDLVEFGLGDLSLKIVADLEALVGWSYGPGVIDQICLSQEQGENRYLGSAHFGFPGQINLHIGLNGALKLVVEVAEILEVLSLRGELDIDMDGLLKGNIDTLVEIGYDSDKEDKSESPYSLDTSIEMAALTGLNFTVGTGLALEIFDFPIWEIRDPATFERNWGYVWTGGLIFDNTFLPSFNFGSIEEAEAADLEISQQQSGKQGKKKSRSPDIPITAMVRRWLANSTVEADGLSCKTALPIQWFKPIDLYPSELDFDPQKHPDVYPTSVNRDAGPTRVSHSGTFDDIGVASENWPTGGWAKCFQLIPEAKSRRESHALRELLEELGYDVNPVEIDHIRELQFGGKDNFNNLWPMDKRANGSAGSLHEKQFAAYRKIFGNINGLHFFLREISLTPDM